MTQRQQTILVTILNELHTSKREDHNYFEHRPSLSDNPEKQFVYCLDGEFDLQKIAIAIDNQLKLADAK